MKPDPVNIYIDREGTWYADGNEVLHPKIFKLFCDSLVLEDDGYHVRIDYMENPVIVEDAPFSVRLLFIENTAEGKDIIWLVLNDESRHQFDKELLRTPAADALYFKIPDGRGMEARFSARALEQFAALLEQGENDDVFILELNGEKIEIRIGQVQ